MNKHRKVDLEDVVLWTMGIFAGLLVLLLIVGLGFVIYDSATGLTCRTQAEIYGLNYQYRFFGGCFVNTPEFGWVLFEEYQSMLMLR